MNRLWLPALCLSALVSSPAFAAQASSQTPPAPTAASATAPPSGSASQTPRPAPPDASAPAAQTPPAGAQTPAQPVGATGPVREPPAGSPPVVRSIELRFPRQGNVSVVEPQTYLYYIQTRPSRTSDNTWIPYNEQTVLEDFKRLWNTNFLDDLWIEVNDAPYSNGVIGKQIVFNMDERQRIKIVDYVGTKVLEQTKIDEKLKEKGLTIRLDTFIDPSLINKVKGVVRDMLSEKGYLDARIKEEVKSVSGGPKTVHLTFNIDEGPKYKIHDIDFIGNKAVSDGKLKKHMKDNKEQWFLSFITSRGTYQQNKFEDDAEKVTEFYRDEGYIAARIGQPEVRTLEDTPDGKTRYVQLQVPVTEGARYKVGDFAFEGNTVVKSEGLRPLFKLKSGDYYAEKAIRKGMEKAREVYGSGGYFEFTGYPDLKPRDQAAQDGDNAAVAPTPVARTAGGGAPVVDVTMRMQEGKQYFVNRITFTGNTTTRDNVIRREIRLFEGGVFNTEALKLSIKRLNQLGYFKNLEGDAIKVDKTPGEDAKVDVTLKFEEQNRNQLTFGAGVSQFEGFFGQLQFQTANFMGRGETFSVGVQAGSRAQNYQVGFTEPFLFDRPISGGVDLFKRELRYPYQYTQDSVGGNIMVGFPVINYFTRMFIGYSYESLKIKDLNPFYNDPAVIQNNPYLADALLLGQNGRRTVSKVVPSIVYNTVDNPIFPTAGKKLTAAMDFAGLGGNTNFLRPTLEGIWYIPHTRRTSIGLRGQWMHIDPYGSTQVVPIVERLFLGGEYSVRGFDIRSIGPRDPRTGLVVGGISSLLFNAEYLIQIAGPVRLVIFYDAGQVPGLKPGPDVGFVGTPLPPLYGPQIPTLGTEYEKFKFSEFKTSTGAEIRFFMPVLNVPFRLIFAANPQRTGVYQNNGQPAKEFTFRFAVGSTF